MTLWVSPDGTTYVRKGSCPPERCGGYCCEFIALPYILAGNESAVQWARLHEGVEVLNATDDVVTIKLASRCIQLTHDGLCGIYEDPARPDVCTEFPHSPLDLIGNEHCGFYFEPVRAKETVRG